MPNEERKWRAYKRAIQEKDFTENIIPIFTGTTCTDDYGTWTTSNKNVVDGSNSTCLSGSTNDAVKTTWTLDLPEGTTIRPSKFNILCTLTYNFYIYGYNESTQTWDKLCDGPKVKNETKTMRSVSVTTDKFYRQLKLQFQSYTRGIVGDRCRLYTFEIIEGTIKK
jgi:hypothetical protein